MPEPSIQDFIVEQTNFFQPEPAWASLSQQDQNRLLQDREQDQRLNHLIFQSRPHHHNTLQATTRITNWYLKLHQITVLQLDPDQKFRIDLVQNHYAITFGSRGEIVELKKMVLLEQFYYDFRLFLTASTT